MKNKINGFGLIEILIALSLISILVFVGVPAMQHLTTRNRVNTYVNQLVTAINFARSEAIKRGQPVIFCGSGNLKNCDGQWQKGQIILMNNHIARVFQALPAGDQLSWSSSLGKDTALEMLPTGFTNGQNGSFIYCPHDKQYAKKIVINQTGRVRVTDDSVDCNNTI